MAPSTIDVYPQRGRTYPDANDVPITSEGATVAVSPYISDAIDSGYLLTDDPFGVFQPQDRTGNVPGGAAPNNPAFILLAPNPSLPNARVLVEGANMTFTDSGPGGTLTLSGEPGGGSGLPPGWYNVKDYGALGDGVTDDTVAIQLAIDTVAAIVNSSTAGDSSGDPGNVTNVGGIVYFPPGVYIVSAPAITDRAWKLAMRSNVSLYGAGYTSVLQSALGQAQSSRTIAMDSAGPIYNVTLKGLRIYGRETEQPPVLNYQRAGIFMQNTYNFRVEDCFIHDTADCIRMFGPLCERTYIARNEIYGCPTDIGREVVQMEGCRNSVITDNFIHDCPYANGIKMEGASPTTLFNNIVSNNQIRNCNGGILVAGGCLVEGNIVENSKGSGEGGCQISGPDVRFVNNTILAAHLYGVSVFRQATNVEISGNLIKNVTKEPGPTNALGIAIEERDGLMPGRVKIQNNIIVGDADMSDCIRFVHCEDHLDISGNLLTGAASGVTVQAVSDVSDISIANNTIRVGVNGGSGVALFSGTGATISHISVAGNLIAPESGVTGTIGLLIDETPGGTIEYVLATGNDLGRCATPISGDGGVVNKVVANNL